MDLADRLFELSRRIEDRLAAVQTEEATKNALVMPFINALGYNVFDPTEVVPELTADVGTKKGEKVDYAILRGGAPVMLFECKACSCDLADCHASQLYRYFSVTDARFGVLTNGVCYQFFSDLEAPNKMDAKPFLEIDLRALDEAAISELKKFSKASFDVDSILETASDLKYTKAIKRVLAAEMSQPSEELVRFFASRVYAGRMTQAVREQFTRLTRSAMSQFVSERIADRLKSALAEEEQSSAPRPEDAVPAAESVESEISTTEAELQGFYIVKAILSARIEPSRVVLRDRKSYCGVLLDDNNRKPICRLHFNGAQKYVGLFDAEKNETRHAVDGPEELYRFAGELLDTVARYDGEAAAIPGAA